MENEFESVGKGQDRLSVQAWEGKNLLLQEGHYCRVNWGVFESDQLQKTKHFSNQLLVVGKRVLFNILEDVLRTFCGETAHHYVDYFDLNFHTGSVEAFEKVLDDVVFKVV